MTHWSSRLLAAELGISNVKVAGVWRAYGLLSAAPAHRVPALPQAGRPRLPAPAAARRRRQLRHLQAPRRAAWLDKNPRITLHFTSVSGSWLNMVEIFGIITRQAIRRGSFTSVKDLIAAIETYIDGWNDRCHPFTWTKTADQLIEHCKPGKRTSFTRH